MGKKTLIKSIIAIAGALYAAFILQTAIFARIPLAGVTPNLILIIISMFGFFKGTKYGMICGFMGGLMMDVFVGSHFGMYALIYTYIGLINGLLSTFFYGDDIKLPLFLVGGSDFFFGMIIYASMFLLRNRNDLGFYAVNIMIPETIYTMVIAMFLFFPLQKLCQWIDQADTGRGTRGNRVIG